MALESIKAVLAKSTPKVTSFPALVFPVLIENGQLLAKRIPVLSWHRIEAIERQANFKAWAADPRTGEVNIEIDQADLSKAVKEWVAGMGPTKPH